MAAFLGSLDFMGLSQRPMGGVLVSPQNDTLGFVFGCLVLPWWYRSLVEIRGCKGVDEIVFREMIQLTALSVCQ